MKKLFTVVSLFLLMQSAWAIDIKDAKDQGLVGEANTGFLAAVQPSASGEVRALIEDVNSQRRTSFENTAKKNGLTVAQVANRFYEIAVEKTQKGHYYQDAGGHWVKK